MGRQRSLISQFFVAQNPTSAAELKTVLATIFGRMTVCGGCGCVVYTGPVDITPNDSGTTTMTGDAIHARACTANMGMGPPQPAAPPTEP